MASVQPITLLLIMPGSFRIEICLIRIWLFLFASKIFGKLKLQEDVELWPILVGVIYFEKIVFDEVIKMFVTFMILFQNDI